MTWRRKPLPPANTIHMNQAILRLKTAVNRLKELAPK